MKGLLHIPSEDGSVEKVAVEFSDDDIRRLSLFCEDAWRLRKSSLFGSNSVGAFTFNMNPGEKVSMQGDGIDDEAWGAAMIRVRPILLKKEPSSFFQVVSLLSKKIDSQRARAQLKAIKQIFHGDCSPMSMEWMIGGKSKSIDDVFYLWLNAFEHHRDRDKREYFDVLSNMGLDYQGMRYLIYMHLGEKLRGIMYLFKFVTDIFGDVVKPSEFKLFEQGISNREAGANG